MPRTSPMKAILFILLLLAEACFGQSATFLPVGDGTFSNEGNFEPFFVAAYASEAPAGFEGDLQFARFDASPYTSIYLELNLASRPLSATPLYVYGYDNASGTLTTADYNAGAYLGPWDVPFNLDFNQEILFNVTDFVRSAQGDFFGFDLRVDGQAVGGADYFTSTLSNNGIPPALIAVIPEPRGSTLLASGIGIWVLLARFRRRKHVRARIELLPVSAKHSLYSAR